MTAGYWATNYWSEGHWDENYWADYGAVTAVTFIVKVTVEGEW